MAAPARSSFLPPLWVLTLLGVFVTLWLLVQLKEIVVLVVVGYAIAYYIDPLVSFFERRKVSRSMGFSLVFISLAALVLLIVMTALPTVIREYGKLSENFPEYLSTVQQRVAPYIERMQRHMPRPRQTGEVEGPPSAPLEQLPSIGENIFRTLTSGLFGALMGGYSLTLTLINLALLPFIVFYLSVDFRRLHEWALAFVPPRQRRIVAQMASEINRSVSAFVRGQLLVGFILFVLYSLGLGIIGLDLWFLLAVVTGFGNLIPYIGFFVGFLLSSIMALVTFGDFWHVSQVWAVYLVIMTLECTVITPKIVGGKVGLSPLAIILAIFAGGQLFGLLGVFLAIPGAAVVRVLGRYLHQWALQRMAAV